jgi:hypothetical protein
MMLFSGLIGWAIKKRCVTPWDNGTLRFGLLQQPVHDVGIDEADRSVGEGEG